MGSRVSWLDALRLTRDEAPLVARAAAVHFLLLTANYMLRPVRDALAVTDGVGRLPWLFTATFVGVLVLQPLYAAAVARMGRAQLVPWVYRICAVVLLLFFGVFQTRFRVEGAMAFFVWMSVFNLFALSLLWSVLADRTREVDARRLFGLVAVGGSAGAIVGPLVAGVVARFASPGVLLVLAAVVLEAGVRVGRAVWAGASEPDPSVPRNPLAGAWQVLVSRKLRGLSFYLLLMTWASTVAYFAQGNILHAEFSTDGERTQVLAAIDLAVNVASLLLQAVVTGRLLSRFGVGVGLLALPAIASAGFAALAVFPTLFGLVALQFVRRVSNYALSKPAREVLYTSVPPAQRYQAKSFVDTVVYRGGDAVAGWGFAGLQTLGLTLSSIATVAVGLGALWTTLAHHLARTHRSDSEDGPPSSQ